MIKKRYPVLSTIIFFTCGDKHQNRTVLSFRLNSKIRPYKTTLSKGKKFTYEKMERKISEDG